MGKRPNRKQRRANAAHARIERVPPSIKETASATYRPISVFERVFLFLENGIVLTVMGATSGFAGVFIDGRYFLLLCIPLALGLHRSGALKELRWPKAVTAYAFVMALSGIALWWVGEGINRSREHIPSPQDIATEVIRSLGAGKSGGGSIETSVESRQPPHPSAKIETLRGVIETTSLFYSAPNHPMTLPNPVLAAIVTIHNQGHYPTTASDFWIAIKWENGEVSKVKATLLTKVIALPYLDGHQEMMYPEDDLCEKGLTPIPVGGQIVGRLMFQDSSINPYRIQNERPKIEISFADIRGSKFSVSSATEWPADGTNREFPGMHLRFTPQQ